MPQQKNAEKSLRQIKKRTAKNNKIRASLDILARQLKKALSASDKNKAEEIARQLAKAVDKAAQKRVLTKNTAARKKSRMMKKVNAVKK